MFDAKPLGGVRGKSKVRETYFLKFEFFFLFYGYV